MSKEIALLRIVKVLLECSNMEPLQGQTDLIIKEIEELLAQPEPEQSNKWWYGKGVEDTKYFLKREPLSIQEIYDLDKYSHQPFEIYTVRECIHWIRMVEKAHGIGVSDE